MTAPSPADSTRARIAAAAKTEFSRYGIAGARVDRIAKEARTSKERVYAYFRSKEALYTFIAGRELLAVIEATPMDPTDLPEYAGRLFDYFNTNPEHFRLLSWGRLERATFLAELEDAYQAAILHKVEQIRAGQQDGYLDPTWDPIDVLALVNQIASSWVAQEELARLAAEQALDPDTAARRAVVVNAVQRLFPAAADARDATA
ncbi:TetR family transcriptional regulator [Streptomyces sp. NPDC055722]